MNDNVNSINEIGSTSTSPNGALQAITPSPCPACGVCPTCGRNAQPVRWVPHWAATQPWGSYANDTWAATNG